MRTNRPPSWPDCCARRCRAWSGFASPVRGPRRPCTACGSPGHSPGEPIYYNAGCIVPSPEFLAILRRLTAEHNVLLVFDEVLCAFRMAAGGAQEYLKVTPDLCTLGKAVGGGFPLSVFGGRKDVMDR